MARRSSRTSTRRDRAPIATLDPLEHVFGLSPWSVRALPSIEDHRLHRPAPPVVRSVSTRPARVLVAAPGHRAARVARTVDLGAGFVHPERVVLCLRREARKRVLHALKKTGRGKSRRAPVWSWRSDLSCKG